MSVNLKTKTLILVEVEKGTLLFSDYLKLKLWRNLALPNQLIIHPK